MDIEKLTTTLKVLILLSLEYIPQSPSWNVLVEAQRLLIIEARMLHGDDIVDEILKDDPQHM